MKRGILFVFAGVCMAVLALSPGCGRGPRGDGGVTETGNTLRETALLILWAQIRSSEDPPLAAAELIPWLREHKVIRPDEPFMRIDNGLVVDAWGSPIVLIAEDRVLTALGSRGPNGTWDGGRVDDLVQKLEPLRRDPHEWATTRPTR